MIAGRIKRRNSYQKLIFKLIEANPYPARQHNIRVRQSKDWKYRWLSNRPWIPLSSLNPQ